MSTATAIRPADLAALTDDDLQAMFARACDEANEELQRVILAVADKRDRAAAYWRKVTDRNNALREEWRQAAYAQYLAAEAVTNGYLVRRGSPLTDAFRLWSGSERFAMAHASEELVSFWRDFPRVTVTAYLAQHADAQQVYRDDLERAGMDAGATSEGDMSSDRLDNDAAADVRHDSAGPADSAIPGARPAGNAGHVRGPVITRDSDDGARVDVIRGGVPAGHAYRVQVKAGGFLRYAWWGVRADGSMSLRPDKRAAVRAVLA